ncbi:hypothetical protein G3N61_24470, partial [Burkholderia sp. Ac-20349]|nr:hypothetical protein [Burkholderia sp. Ac-20349]
MQRVAFAGDGLPDARCRMNARVQVLVYSDEMLIVRWLAPGGAEQRW